MAPTLYMMHGSTAARAVLMAAEAIGLHLIEKEVNILANEHLTPEYLKINPQHTIPTFVDEDGFTLSDSHSIMAYIVSKYAKNDHLYPQDLKKKALVDQRLHFDTGVAFAKLTETAAPIYLQGKNRIDEDDTNVANEVYAFLEAFLEGRKFVAGDSVTIADYSINTSITGFNILVPVDSRKFPKVAEWMNRCEELPEYQVNVKGLKLYEEMLKSKLIS